MQKKELKESKLKEKKLEDNKLLEVTSLYSFGEAEPVRGILEREYKDRLIRMIFKDKSELLSLYNAVNGTHYTNPDDLQINTLDNAIYMGMHNDLSFLIDFRMSVYEHQSTYSPNMPMRGFLYVARLYAGITRNSNLYGTKLVKIPTPKFVVFYNGETEKPDLMELKLSDAFEIQDDDVSLELKMTMLNINEGHNEKLLSECKTLGDYSRYVAKVRAYAKTMPIADAVELAIEECIKDDILADFLRKYRAEAKSVSIYEYDEARHMAMEREENRREGREEGREEGRKEGEIKKVIKQTRANFLKGIDMETIAEFLDESLDEVEKICELIEENPDADVDEIYQLMDED